MLRGTAIGSILGVLPGGGAALSSFAAYAVEKKSSRNPERFGRGAIEGVAAPEAANNAGAQTSFIPLLTLGIPGNAIMALMVGAMMIQGIQPGPQVMTAQPQLFWGVIASMWLGNLMLIVLNLPMIGLWVSLLRVPYRVMFPMIVLFCCIGTYSVGNTVFDIWVMLLFGVLGVFFYKVGAEPAPFVLGFILGPLMEENFRRAMYLSRGDPMVFVERPISALLLALALGLLGAPGAAGGEAEAGRGVQGVGRVFTTGSPSSRNACTCCASASRFFSSIMVCVPSASITRRLPGELTSSGNSACAI